MQINQYTKGDRVPWENVAGRNIGCLTEKQAAEREYWAWKTKRLQDSILPRPDRRHVDQRV